MIAAGGACDGWHRIHAYVANVEVKTCHVLGQGGFDLDVLYNVMRFYRSLGLTTFFSRKPASADLLVILRPRGISVNWRNYGAVHIWDYVGGPVDAVGALADSGPDELLVFASSKARAEELTTQYTELNGRVKILLPPVDVFYWSESIGRLRGRNTVHIGHYKKFIDGEASRDVYGERFLERIRAERTEVWGAGWEDLSGVVTRGPLNLHMVSRTYAETRVALGIMYPHQRPRTLSGRFWHAPLNGCVLLSEPSTYSGGAVPGVIEYSYELEDFAKLVDELPDPAEIQRDAFAYWQNQFDLAREEIAGYIPTARRAPPRKALSALRGSIDNAGRKLWHRIR